MRKGPFFQILLLSLVLIGMSLEEASFYMEKGSPCTFTYCDFEQDQEDTSSESKSTKGDKYRPLPGFSPLALIAHQCSRRCHIPVCSEGGLPAAFLPIFTPPPEQV